MKILIILLFILLFKNGYSQSDFDSLKKYIYPIIGIDNAAVDGASCFFVRHQKSIYLVTAKHVLSGCLNDSTKSEFFAGKHYIFLGSYLNSIKLNTTVTKKVLPCDGIDLVIWQLMDTSMSKYIYSVEDYLRPDFSDFKSILIGGFPATGFKKNMLSSLPGVSFLHIPDKHFEILNFPDLNGNYDPNTFGVDWKGKVITKTLLEGYSGAPVFIQDRSTLKWKIAGLLSGFKNNPKDADPLIIIDVVAILNKLDELKLFSTVQPGNIFIY